MMEVTTRDQAHVIRQEVQKAFGFVPNLLETMIEHSPAVARLYLDGNQALQNARLTPAEQQAVILAVSSYNDCHYCTAAHAKAGAMAGLPQDAVAALLEGGLPEDERLRNLTIATRRILGKRGWLNEVDLADLEARGIDRTQLYEIIAIVGLKTVSNYINHINQTEIDPQFR